MVSRIGSGNLESPAAGAPSFGDELRGDDGAATFRAFEDSGGLRCGATLERR